MYYGEGAGNRRKLIKAKVKQRSTDAAYKKAFDNHVANTDWEKRAQQARGKRRRQDAKSGAMRRMMHEINIYNGRRKFNKQFG